MPSTIGVPRALIGTPTILSAVLITALVFIPALALSDVWRARALTFGLLTGYLVYAIVHHATHHWRSDLAWLRHVRRHHALHHSPVAAPARYGVTSAFWDVVFRTNGPPVGPRTAPDSARDELMRSVLSHVPGADGESAFEFAEVIRAEIFSAERLEQHAASLAAAQSVTKRPVAVRPLSARLRDNHRALLHAHRTIAKSIAAGGAITPAAEWLVDNYHVVEAQIRQVRDDMPPGYYRQLPKLADGPLAGYPRVLGLAWAFVAHTDSRFDASLLRRFVAAYQRVQPLTIGELWAIAITLRVVLIENLRRAAELIARPSCRPAAGRPRGRPAPRGRRPRAQTLASVLPELESVADVDDLCRAAAAAAARPGSGSDDGTDVARSTSRGGRNHGRRSRP